MVENDNKQGRPGLKQDGNSVVSCHEWADTLLNVVDELDEVLALNTFFNEAVDVIQESRDDGGFQLNSERGMTLFRCYLEQRVANIRSNLKRCSHEKGNLKKTRSSLELVSE